MDLLSLSTPEEAYRQVKELSSELSDDEHLIRSCVFDLHAAVELELRRIYYHVFKRMIFLTNDEAQNAETLAKFERMIERLSFMDMYRVLRPILNSWPYPDLEAIGAINEARNKAAHGGDTAKVLYMGRNPFRDPDAFAQMYFDVWAMKQSFAKFFDWTIAGPREELQRYREKFGEI
jgi:hypothetical protein